jgi:hypothetical protein
MPQVIFIAQLVLLFAVGRAGAADAEGDGAEPVKIIQAYLRATYARDFREAYWFISAEDRKVRDVNRYVQYRSAFTGFTLVAARKISEAVQVESIEQKTAGNRLSLLVRYRVPDAQKIAPVLLDWNPGRLNALSGAERQRLLAVLETKQRDGSLAMIEGEARFELVREANDWRVFLDWQSGVRVPLRVDGPRTSGVEVSLSKPEVVVVPGDAFDVELVIKNAGEAAITVMIGHLVEPTEAAEYVDFVQCGFLLPVTVPPNTRQEYSGVYLLRGSLPEGVRRVALTYDVRVLR